MDLTAFEQAPLSVREKDVPVPQLATWFEEGEPAVWRVRALDGAELGWLDEENDRQKQLISLATAFGGGNDIGKAVREFFCMDQAEESKTYARQISVVLLASVNPKLYDPANDLDKRSIVVRLAKHYPGTFRLLHNEITKLTGQGSEPGKPKGSGKTRKSAPE